MNLLKRVIFFYGILFASSASFPSLGWSKPLQIVTGRDMTCVRHDTGAVDCWGPWQALEKSKQFNCDYQECNGPISILDGLTEANKALLIEARENALCALTQGFDLRCWKGSLAPLAVKRKELPQHLPLGIHISDDEVSMVYPTTAHTYSFKSGHWQESEIAGLRSPERIIKMSSGIRRSCFLTSLNRVICTTTPSLQNQANEAINVQLLGLNRPIKQVAVGTKHLCFLSTEGLLKCVGDNERGQSGLYQSEFESNDTEYVPYELRTIKLETVASRPPLELEPGLKVERIWARYFETCAQLTNRLIKCFGDNIGNKMMKKDSGDVTFGTILAIDAENNLPLRLGRNKNAVELAIGPMHSCAILTDKSVRCWGSNGGGRLGYIQRGNPICGDQECEQGDGLLPLQFTHAGRGR